MQLALSKQEVEVRVMAGNGFSREEFMANRELIKACRADKREKLSRITGSQMGTIIEQKQAEGFVLADVKATQGKRVDTVMYVYKRKSQLTEAEHLKNQIEKLQAKLAKL